jgi:hypothetical protein
MNHLRTSPALLFIVATIACGPPRVGDGPTDGSTGADETATSTSDPDPSGTETSGVPTTNTFYPEEDLDHEDCDPWQQDDCPTGEKCVPYAREGGSWDANKCVPVLGDQAVGEPCEYAGLMEATDNCDAGSICWNVDAEGNGVCEALCWGSPQEPMCPPSSECLISGSGVISLCIPQCDPIMQNCEAGLGCYWTGGAFNCVTAIEDIPAGQPCGFINDCAIGLMCIATEFLPDCEGASCCTPYCDATLGDGPCEVVPGTTCTEFFESRPPPGYETVGVCVAP